MQKFWSIIGTLIPEKPQSNAHELIENEIGVNINPAKLNSREFQEIYSCTIGNKLTAKIQIKSFIILAVIRRSV